MNQWWGDVGVGLSAASERGSVVRGHGKPSAPAQPSAREGSALPALPAVQVLGKGCVRAVQGTCLFSPFSLTPSRLTENIPGGMVPHVGLSLCVPSCLPVIAAVEGMSCRAVMIPSVPPLQAPSALCHPLHHPLLAWGHPLHPLPSGGSARAEPCPVPPQHPPCSRQQVRVWWLHGAGMRGIPRGWDAGRSLPGFQMGVRTHGSAGLPVLGCVAGRSPASCRHPWAGVG